MKTTKSKTLYIDGEMPENLIEKRLSHLGQRFGDPELVSKSFFLLTREKLSNEIGVRINLFTEESRNAIRRTLIENKIDCVIIDSLSFLMSWQGTAIKEYKDEELYWEKIRDWLFDLELSGITTFFVHHTLKGSETMKGSSTLTQFPETILRMMPWKPTAAEKKAGIVLDESFGWPVEIEYEKNRNFLEWERLPKMIRLVRDPSSPQDPLVVANHGWKSQI